MEMRMAKPHPAGVDSVLSSVLSYTGWVLQSYLSFAEETVRIPVVQEQI